MQERKKGCWPGKWLQLQRRKRPSAHFCIYRRQSAKFGIKRCFEYLVAIELSHYYGNIYLRWLCINLGPLSLHPLFKTLSCYFLLINLFILRGIISFSCRESLHFISNENYFFLKGLLFLLKFLLQACGSAAVERKEA